MSILILIIVVLLNFLLQSTILPYIAILGVVPNTTLLIVMSISLFKGKYYGGFTGLIIGLLQDIIFSSVIGINSFIYFFAGYITGMVENKLSRENPFIPILFSLVGTIYYNFMYYIFMFFLSTNIPFLSFSKSIMLVEILYNIIAAIPIYMIFSKMFKEPTIKFARK